MAAHHEDGNIQNNADGAEPTSDESFLEDLAVEVKYRLHMSNYDRKLLLPAYRENVFPSSLLELYRLLVITERSQLEPLKRLCLKHLFRHPKFFGTKYPKELPDSLLLTCFEESSKRLFRTKGIYMYELYDIVKLGRGDRLKESLFRAFRSKVDEFGDLGLECVPFYFSKRSVPVVISRSTGEPQSTLSFYGDCLRFEMFGKNFDLYETDLDSFYLKYATYVLYKSGDAVFYKDLRDCIQARKVMEKSVLFISKEDDVFVVTRVKSEDRILKWVENDEDGGSFAVLHRMPGDISNLDFDPDTGILLVLEKSGFLSLRRLEKRELVLLRRYHGNFRSAWFHRSRVFTLSLEEETADGFDQPCLKLHRKSLTDIKSYPEIDERTEEANEGELEVYKDEELQKFAENGRIVYLGQTLFKISDKGLETHGPLSGTVLNCEHFVAVSELCLLP